MTSLAQESPQLQSRYTNTAHAVHSRFDQGMIRDIASWELPEGALYDAQDLLCDYVGKIRKRGGTTNTATGNAAAFGENLTAYASGGVDGRTGLWSSLGKGGVSINMITKGTGTATNVFAGGSNDTIACKPFQFGNLLVFSHSPVPPGTTTSDRNLLILGGGGTTGASLTAATIVANDNRVTGITGGTMTASMLGSIIELDGSSNYYIGRVVEITSTTAVRVEPTPLFGFTATDGIVTPSWQPASLGVGDVYTGRFGTAFQNRIVLAYTSHTQGNTTANYAKGIDLQPYRLIWSSLPTELSPLHTLQTDGNGVLYPATWQQYNYQDIPNIGYITGLANLGDGQLVIFGPQKMFILSGQLTTQTVSNNAINYSVDQVSANVGCIDARSIRYARGGIIFAGYDNIYYWGGSSVPQPILNGKNQRYYQTRIRNNDTVYGSAYFTNQNHYYLSMSGTDGGLLINLDDNYATVRLTGPCLQIFDSASDPIFPQTIWSVRWWDKLGAPPTMVKGQLNQLDSIFAPTSANTADIDGTNVIFDLQTASYVDGRIGTNKLPVDLNMTYKLTGSGSPTATLKADTKLDTSDASYVTIDAAVPSNTVTTTKDWEIGPLLPDGQAVQFRLTGTACTSFELDALDIGSHQGPDGFST